MPKDKYESDWYYILQRDYDRDNPTMYTAYSCNRCGALTTNVPVHNAWHGLYYGD